MTLIRLASCLYLSSMLSLAGSWTGSLVDSRCYENEESNVNPTDTLTSVDRDRDREIRYCAPRAKTKSFTIVQRDGSSLKLDPGENSKALELVQKAGKRRFFNVTVTGELNGKTIKVDSISLLEN
jgi:hypothetical protein